MNPLALFGLVKGIPIWVWPVLGLALWGWNGNHSARKLRDENVTLRAQWDARVAEQTKALDTEVRRLKDEGAALRAKKERAENDLQIAVKANSRRLADERASSELRIKTLTEFAAGGGPAAGDTLASCSERAAAVGGVLGQTLRASAECAAEAEDLAGGVRTLQRAWPK